MKSAHKYNFYFFSLGLILMLLFTACSVKKNTWSNRIYHNLSAHYNGYWNGKESYKEGLGILNSSLKENYTTVLPVFNYGTEQDAQSLSTYMERAIQKASIVIQKHSMRFQRKEYNRWIDDAYLLIGKSYFYTGEYISARRTFEFVINEFKSSSSAYEAMLWLIRTYNRSGQYEKAEPLLKQFQDFIDYENVPLGLQREYPMIYANFYLMQGKEAESVEYLIRSIEINNSKQLITRLKYILAQVYQNQNKFEEASELFTEVIHRSPDYDMAFNAKVNRAKCYYTDAGNFEEIIQSLEVLLKDPKNQEYLDQIYFVIAEIAVKQKNVQMAIVNLKKSVASSRMNNLQKATSSLTLADLFFEQSNYTEAKLYYDTAMQSLPRAYPDYQDLYERTDVLVTLVGYLENIQLQDSLQKLALMPENDRLAIIDALIEDVKTKEKEVQLEQQRTQSAGMIRQQNTFMQTNQGDGSWYFYNPSTLSYGYTEFVAKWGRRPLEDNWRLSQKQMAAVDFPDEIPPTENNIVETEENAASAGSNKDRSFYLKNIPLNEAQLVSSNKIIEDALFQSAMLYNEGLKDKQRAIEQFEELISRFPENEYLLQSFYYLHRLYISINNEKSGYYKQKLLQQFPNTDYAKVLLNPEYYKELSSQKSEIESLYLDTYQAYQNEQYFVCIRLSEQAVKQFSDTLYIPKFEYLRALSVGRIENQDSLMVHLQRIVKKYPKSEVVPMAQKLIEHLQSSANLPELILTDTIQAEAINFGEYEYNPDTSHIYILIISSERVNLDAVKLRLSDFNVKRTLSGLLTITSFEVEENKTWLSVTGLRNKQEAMDYLGEMLEDGYVLSMLNPEEFEQFVIGINNYSVLLQLQDTNVYLNFYHNYYQTTK